MSLWYMIICNIKETFLLLLNDWKLLYRNRVQCVKLNQKHLSLKIHESSSNRKLSHVREQLSLRIGWTDVVELTLGFLHWKRSHCLSIKGKYSLELCNETPKVGEWI